VEPKFGDIFFASISGDGHIQAGNRPVLIAQNDVGNHFSPTVEVIPISSRIEKARRKHLPTQVIVIADQLNGLSEDSVVLGEQPRTINKTQLLSRIGRLGRRDLVEVGKARSIQSPFPTSA
jgi:mRNA interferase MazF